TEITTATGTSAATSPLTLISAVKNATSSIISTSRRERLPPARATSSWPAQEVTPADSSPSLTTKSDAMKRTVGSPKPASDWSRLRTPVAQSASAVPSATVATGKRSQANTTTTAARTTKVMVV